MFGAIIREWDGSLARVGTVRSSFAIGRPYDVTDVVRMTYSDGTTHEVSWEYFKSIFVFELLPNDLPSINYTPAYWDVV